jgi:hypothetical protein
MSKDRCSPLRRLRIAGIATELYALDRQPDACGDSRGHQESRERGAGDAETTTGSPDRGDHDGASRSRLDLSLDLAGT